MGAGRMGAMWPRRLVILTVLVLLAAVILLGCDVTRDPAPATTTSSTTTTTEAPPPEPPSLDRMVVPEPDGACERLNQATAGDTIWLDTDPDTPEPGHFPDSTGGDTSKDFACDVRGQDAYGVTVTGSWTGDVQCHGCDGWKFDQLEVEPGSLRMIGGREWTISNARIVGGNRGLMAVLGTGSTDASEVQTKSPYRWRIDRVNVGGAGCRPAGDKYPSHVRALYVVGKNSTALGGLHPNDGFITNSRFWGHRCGYVVKLGSTANFGVHSESADAADIVTFTGNTVEVVETELPDGVPEQPVPILVSGHSDGLTITDNEFLGAGKYALVASGPFTGHDLVFTDNRFEQDNMMMQWRRYGPPPWWVPNVALDSPLAYLMGQSFVAFPPGPCHGLGTCAGNEPVR